MKNINSVAVENLADCAQVNRAQVFHVSDLHTKSQGCGEVVRVQTHVDFEMSALASVMLLFNALRVLCTYLTLIAFCF